MNESPLEYIANHAFFPPKLPQEDDYQICHEEALCSSVVNSALAYRKHIPADERDRWDRVTKMLQHLQATQEFASLYKESLIESIAGMQTGDIRALYIRAQNAGLVIRKLSDQTVFEMFEVSLPNETVMAAEGKILRSFPGPAIAVPHTTANNPLFIEELSSFLVQMHVDIIEPPMTRKAGCTVKEVRDTTAPHYITQLLTGILRGMGHPAEVKRVQKRIAEDVLWNDAFAPWRRSPIWLVIRVALQISLIGENGKDRYKSFMLFALAGMLQETLAAGLPSDVLFCMRSKVCRRLHKLGPAVPLFVQEKVQEVVEATERLLQERWKAEQMPKVAAVAWAPHDLNICEDTVLSLHKSGDYLRNVLSGNIAHSGENIFNPKCTPRLQGPLDFGDYGTEKLSEAVKSDPYTALADFELAVQELLEGWVGHNLHVEDKCEVIAACFKQYHTSAHPIYKGDPVLLSTMLLTLAQLWVAVDRLVIAQCPLLQEYSPEFPTNLMEPLLLRTSRALNRVKYVETYVLSRHLNAQSDHRIFTDDLHSQSFAIRYVDASSDHISLMEKITTQADALRKEKALELKRLNIKHSDLLRQCARTKHLYRVDSDGDEYHARHQCDRCTLEQQAKDMRITLHEWPLPRDELEAKAAVFELECPPSFGTWRTITYHFLRDICFTSHESSADPPMRLHAYEGLQPFKDQNSSYRISFASTTKSYAQSHYATTSLPSSESEVCVNNGLRFMLFDTERSEWAALAFEGCSVAEYCTSRLPKGPYAFLQYAVGNTSHTSNGMLAAQDDCPTDLSLHEYAAFVGLRAGPRLQWLNIARELRTGALTFRREEVFILLTQAAWEIGPLCNEEREWHGELCGPEFASLLLRELSQIITSIQSNWAEVTCARMVTALTSRLLASTNDAHAIDEAYALLRGIRVITFDWMHDLACIVRETEDEDELAGIERRMCEIAATCRSTYDVDPVHLQNLLHSSDDHAILLECTVVIYDYTPSNPASWSPDFKNLLARDQRLSHGLEETFLRQSQVSSDGLNRAIFALWSGYRKGPDMWTCLPSPNDRWLQAKTAPSASGTTQSVQLNFLEGLLLVEGKPLSRLPVRFSRHPTYTRIFGQKLFDVFPAEPPEMEFTARMSLHDHQVSFAMRDLNTRLVIRIALLDKVSFAVSDMNTRLIISIARKALKYDQVRTCELIPHEIFISDLPSSLIHGYSHWMDLSNGQIELRPLSSIWESSASNWVLHYVGRSSIMRKGSTVLVDIRSPTFGMIHSSLGALDYTDHLVVTWSQTATRLLLLANLPRLKLAFKLNDADLLESLNLSNMVVDQNQSIGTMVGLSNQLVLRESSSVLGRLPRSRRVIVSFGEKITFQMRGHHIDISVDTKSETFVKFYEYRVDNELGRLIGDGSLISKLYQAYLHALSSHCLPDPLTGKTGTQEALHVLSNAGCFSFRALGPCERKILDLLRALAPAHIYYPSHLQVMQSITWLPIPTLTQNQAFHWATRTIFSHAERLNVFETTPRDGGPTPHQAPNDHLRYRAARRMSVYVPDGTINMPPHILTEANCSTRDFAMEEGAKKEEVAATMAASVLEWPSTLDGSPKLLEALVDWDCVGSEKAMLAYSRKWIVRDLGSTWITIYNICRQSDKTNDQFRMAFSLSAMAYFSEKNRSFAPMLLAFATNDAFRNLSPPRWKSYKTEVGFKPQRDQVYQHVISHGSFAASSESRLAVHYEESTLAHARRRKELYQKRLKTQAASVADHCMAQWPIEHPTLPRTPPDEWVFSATEALAQIKALFETRFHNLQLKEHAAAVQNALDGMNRSTNNVNSTGSYHPPPLAQRPLRPHGHAIATLDKLFRREPPIITASMPTLSFEVLRQFQIPDDTGKLRALLTHFTGSENSFQQLYGGDLEKSRQKFSNDQIQVFPSRISYPLFHLVDYGHRCLKSLQEVSGCVRDALSPFTISQHMLHIAGQWPHISLGSLLRILGNRRAHNISHTWVKTLAVLAHRMLLYQRSQRLIHLAHLGNPDDILKELENDNYDIGQEDWLLIQIDGNFQARSIQIEVANEMISPASQENSVLQLNMGEGKSSVIVPMIAASLSDGHTLTRVIVLKSLSGQMFQLLVERLSGLANRRVFYLPFSRSVKMGALQVNTIIGLYEECIRERGILVAQPEHILSFKLMGVERLLSPSGQDNVDIFPSLLKAQRWLEGISRDVLDESDEILHVRYQLLYTVGVQQALEGHPDRWTTIQQLLSLVRKHAPHVHEEFPSGLEVQLARHGNFPVTRILKRTAGKRLMECVMEDVMNGQVANCPFGIFPADVRRAAERIIVEKEIQVDDAVKKLIKYCKGSELWKGVLLLRGLFAHGILSYVLREKRWRVDYGLDLSRSLLAVPYRAKDIPATRAEFGHPDVAITLTCLSYLYGGLRDSEMSLCFELLYKLDNPTQEYEHWVENDPSIPEPFRHLNSVNMEDPKQRDTVIFPTFGFNHLFVDFYLSQVVFPRAAKEFPHKLATSGWDLAERKVRLVTGFSGTNDNQHLLPTSITQRDPLGQLSTNAKVLTYLMRPENDAYMCVHGADGGQLSTKDFLQHLVQQTPEIRVLLDVGAQMLDMHNGELATYWLYLKSDAAAVIFFGDNDEMTVMTRDGPEPLISSPFRQQLEKCLVYLDDVHTRGTDLKLPRDTRAAVTLGPKVTKDRLIQGCMRMRKLGNGQSVMFFAPSEVDEKIRVLATKTPNEDIEVMDILRWSMTETCTDIQHHAPMWAEQGYDHDRRNTAWHETAYSSSRNDLKAAWLRPEAHTLAELYGDGLIPESSYSDLSEFSQSDVSEFSQSDRVAQPAEHSIRAIDQRCKLLGVVQLSNMQMEEEQEREVAHEVQTERQVERPPKAEAAGHEVHPDLSHLVQNGIIPVGSSQFLPAFSMISGSPSALGERQTWSPMLLATRDFSSTVKGHQSGHGEYLRPVNWILSSKAPNPEMLVLLSPYEVNHLLPEIRQSKQVHLHMYSPRITHAMQSLEDLTFYCIPPLPSSWRAPPRPTMTHLNLWAGQLYLMDHPTYEQLCLFLGLSTNEIQRQGEIETQPDGFIRPEHRIHTLLSQCAFAESPVPFLKNLIAYRRKGMGYSMTHMGKILAALPLIEEDFNI
ncbi:hypothetical protein FIBSPDRAFT_1054420 [Athelia psychrophila]|uniref:ubiquitinyl hydrolase 1 n=1 Tax=Athelia psychrophila TaxID=1759441 RepID=A0A167VBX3_9AGAM|nr:hypothetical protein FIBSPDRAFT_1054420 [Fibularhizoctonia sp. CBS 109695]